MYVVADTTDVVPSGTILSTTASLALPARPTASSETVCECPHVLKVYLSTCCFVSTWTN